MRPQTGRLLGSMLLFAVLGGCSGGSSTSSPETEVGNDADEACYKGTTARDECLACCRENHPVSGAAYDEQRQRCACDELADVCVQEGVCAQTGFNCEPRLKIGFAKDGPCDVQYRAYKDVCDAEGDCAAFEACRGLCPAGNPDGT